MRWICPSPRAFSLVNSLCASTTGFFFDRLVTGASCLVVAGDGQHSHGLFRQMGVFSPLPTDFSTGSRGSTRQACVCGANADRFRPCSLLAATVRVAGDQTLAAGNALPHLCCGKGWATTHCLSTGGIHCPAIVWMAATLIATPPTPACVRCLPGPPKTRKTGLLHEPPLFQWNVRVFLVAVRRPARGVAGWPQPVGVASKPA